MRQMTLEVNNSPHGPTQKSFLNKVLCLLLKQILPDLFSEGQGMIGKGYFKSNLFIAKEILAKHDEKYMPIEVIDVLKEQGVFRSTTARD